MVNPAIIAGLVAGYTVSAVVTAFFTAEDPAGTAPDDSATAVADPRAATRCAGALRRGRRAAHCLARRSPNRMVTTQRR